MPNMVEIEMKGTQDGRNERESLGS
jgi:hypothetical protein